MSCVCLDKGVRARKWHYQVIDLLPLYSKFTLFACSVKINHSPLNVFFSLLAAMSPVLPVMGHGETLQEEMVLLPSLGVHLWQPPAALAAFPASVSCSAHGFLSLCFLEFSPQHHPKPASSASNSTT